jgi:TonB family protein
MREAVGWVGHGEGRATREDSAMRFVGTVGAAFGVAVALSAQSASDGMVLWKQFRAPDSSFAIMVPASRPFEHRTQDSGYVSESIYFNDAGSAILAVRLQSHREGASLKFLPSVEGFCTSCLGNVLADTTVHVGPRAGRWLLVESESADSSGRTAKVTSVYRLVGRGPHVYVVSASSQPGRPLSSEAGWFLDSFALCALATPCLAMDESAPPWHGSPFHYLPPSGASGESIAGPMDFGQGFFDYQVDQRATAAPGSASPTYPSQLKAQGISGEVVCSFVVDATGRVEMQTFKIVKSDRAEFVDAVRDALTRMSFSPAEIAGKKVRQIVQQSFTFGKQP